MRTRSQIEPANNVADGEAASWADKVDRRHAYRRNPGQVTGSPSRLQSVGITRNLGDGPRTVTTQMPLSKTALGSSARPVTDHILVPATGLQLPRQLSFETWLGIGRQLSVVVNSSAWCLGDWLVYGEVAYSGRYRDAIERTCLEYKTLRNYAWVARRFPLARRREMLSLGHHAEVAALPEPEQDYWLRKAEEFGWSRNQIRHEVRTSVKGRGDGPADAPSNATGSDSAGTPAGCGDNDGADAGRAELTILVPVTAAQFQLIQQAASQYNQSIEAWVAVALDQAARLGLSQQCDDLAPRQVFREVSPMAR